MIEEVREAIKAGFREIVLCGIHLGLYGDEVRSKKLKVKSSLASLLEKLVLLEKLGRIRLSSIEVNEVTDELVKLIKDSEGKICQHLHIPLQSGCNKILKLMNQLYNVKYYKKKIREIRDKMRDIAITTDVIVGFPGETKKDFQDTYDFIKEMKFSRLHVFPFLAHERTPASKLPNRVEKEETKKRVEKLRELGEKLAKDYKKKFEGREVEIVIEREIKSEKDTRCPIGHRVSYVGKTEFYFDVEFDESQIAANCAQIATNKNLIGEIVNIDILKS